MRRKYLLFSAMLVSMTLLSSCALLPEEEEIRTSPVVREYVQEEYETVRVARGDLVSTERVSARYVPVQKESLYFALIDEYVDKMLVQVGEQVEKGQLLGQLRVDDIEEQIADVRGEMQEAELRLSGGGICSRTAQAGNHHRADEPQRRPPGAFGSGGRFRCAPRRIERCD